MALYNTGENENFRDFFDCLQKVYIFILVCLCCLYPIRGDETFLGIEKGLAQKNKSFFIFCTALYSEILAFKFT